MGWVAAKGSTQYLPVLNPQWAVAPVFPLLSLSLPPLGLASLPFSLLLVLSSSLPDRPLRPRRRHPSPATSCRWKASSTCSEHGSNVAGGQNSSPADSILPLPRLLVADLLLLVNTLTSGRSPRPLPQRLAAHRRRHSDCTINFSIFRCSLIPPDESHFIGASEHICIKPAYIILEQGNFNDLNAISDIMKGYLGIHLIEVMTFSNKHLLASF